MLVVLGGVESAANADFHFETELRVSIQRADVLFLVHDFILRNLLNITSCNITSLVDGERESLQDLCPRSA